MVNRKFVIGVDVGGTKTELVLLEVRITQELKQDERNHLNVPHTLLPHPLLPDVNFLQKDRIRFATRASQGDYQAFLSAMMDIITTWFHHFHFSCESLICLGLGLPGAVDLQQNIMLQGNTKFLIEKNLRKDLAELLHFDEEKIFIENDANCFTLAESLWGVGQKWKESQILSHHFSPSSRFTPTSVGLIMGTGMGGGICFNHRLYRGRRGGVGEFGHTSLNPNGPFCYCGRQGCAELYLSGRSIERRYEELTTHDLPGEKICEMAISGHSIALKIIQETKQYFIQMVTNIINILSPDYIVVGGGLSRQNFLFENLENEVRKQIFVKQNTVWVSKNLLGDSSGVLGAAVVGILRDTVV